MRGSLVHEPREIAARERQPADLGDDRLLAALGLGASPGGAQRPGEHRHQHEHADTERVIEALDRERMHRGHEEVAGREGGERGRQEGRANAAVARAHDHRREEERRGRGLETGPDEKRQRERHRACQQGDGIRCRRRLRAPRIVTHPPLGAARSVPDELPANSGRLHAAACSERDGRRHPGQRVGHLVPLPPPGAARPRRRSRGMRAGTRAA